MNVTMYWFGGSSYSPPDFHEERDAETFDTLADAKAAFASRPGDRHYPMVEAIPPEAGGPEAYVFFGHAVVGNECFDCTLRFGPRGGVVCERA